MKRAGPDPNFPYLTEGERFNFPPIKSDIVAVGGNLSPGMLLSAYEQGIFPWYNEYEPVIWQSPDPRFIIFPQNLHVSSSMKKIFKKNIFKVTFDQDFPSVIVNCASIHRSGQDGTWITRDIVAAYTEMHQLGYAHSAESYLNGQLAGGCYGIRLGGVFFGESMFSKVPNASKAAFLTMAFALFADGVKFIDCQVYTKHLESLGGESITRADFLKLLKDAIFTQEHGV
ncbi:MAG: leucyl/phenylalanyl-tRNA--protein transferase [Treponema sp.]|jgi:leucyl/phenylalanyl-tRNA--protein transferase|nr:leucyl/phenylalanyl-tRNA--protein transferase [Treponema sp.]